MFAWSCDLNMATTMKGEPPLSRIKQPFRAPDDEFNIVYVSVHHCKQFLSF